MPTLRLEVEVVNAHSAFNKAVRRSTPHVQELGERYLALLDEYLENLREHTSGPARGLLNDQFSSSGTAAKIDYQDSIEWARSERERVGAVLSPTQQARNKRSKK